MILPILRLALIYFLLVAAVVAVFNRDKLAQFLPAPRERTEAVAGAETAPAALAEVPGTEGGADAETPAGEAAGDAAGEATAQAAPEPAAPEPVAPEPAAPEPVAPEPAAPEPAAPEPVAPEPAAPESAAPEPFAPEPVTPEPVAPEVPALGGSSTPAAPLAATEPSASDAGGGAGVQYPGEVDPTAPASAVPEPAPVAAAPQPATPATPGAPAPLGTPVAAAPAPEAAAPAPEPAPEPAPAVEPEAAPAAPQAEPAQGAAGAAGAPGNVDAALGEAISAARGLYWSGDLDGARSAMQSLAADHPDNPDVLGELGNLAFALRDYPAAADAWYKAGLLLIERGEAARVMAFQPILGSIDPEKGADLAARLPGR